MSEARQNNAQEISLFNQTTIMNTAPAVVHFKDSTNLPRSKGPTISSVAKKKGTAQNMSTNKLQNNHQNDVSINQEFRELQVTLGEKDIEIERMKATLVALTKKLNLVNDVRDANQADREALAESETRRNELQNQCEMMGNKFEEELTRNKEKQDEYLDEIHELREQVQTLKQRYAAREVEHLKNMDQMQRHHAEQEQEGAKEIEMLV